MVSTGTSLSGESFSDFVDGSVNGPLEDVSFQADLSLEDRLEEISTRVDLMLSCYIDGIKNELEFTYILLTGEPEFRREFLKPDDLLNKIRWLKAEYDPIRSKILGEEIPVDDDDFEILFTTSEILYDSGGDFILESLFDESDNIKVEGKLDEMGHVLEKMYKATQRIRFGVRIKDYIYEYLSLLNVDPRGTDSFDNVFPVQYAPNVERYELALINEFERKNDVRNRLKEKHGMDVTTVY